MLTRIAIAAAFALCWTGAAVQADDNLLWRKPKLFEAVPNEHTVRQTDAPAQSWTGAYVGVTAGSLGGRSRSLNGLPGAGKP